MKLLSLITALALTVSFSSAFAEHNEHKDGEKMEKPHHGKTAKPAGKKKAEAAPAAPTDAPADQPATH